ncbi:hypothetical protein PFISCL1PPCAC_12949, partial [Pristionchus fissidentatus]
YPRRGGEHRERRAARNQEGAHRARRVKGISPSASSAFTRSSHARVRFYSRGRRGSAPVDATVVPAKGKALITTGLTMKQPADHYDRVAPRSGLAAKHFIDVGAGVIDSDYRGELRVLLFNFSDVDFEVKEGDHIAQLIYEKISQVRY